MIALIILLYLRTASYMINLTRFFLGRILYFSRAHDSKLITNTQAFKAANVVRFNVTCNLGPPGSPITDEYTYQAANGDANFPTITWTPPQSMGVVEYALVCEDPDAPIPHHSCALAIIYNIAANKNQLDDNDVRTAGLPNDTTSNIHYIPVVHGTRYRAPEPPLGHGTHRYFFTVIALNAHLQFNGAIPHNKDRFSDALVGKVVGWGQWEGRFTARI